VPLSRLSPCGSSLFRLPQPRLSSALRCLDRSPSYRSGSDIPDCWLVETSLLHLHYVTYTSFSCHRYVCRFRLIMLVHPFSCHRYVCRFRLIMLARPFSCPLRLLSSVDEACTSCSLFLTFTACASFLLLPRVECWPCGGRVRSCVFLGCGDRVMMLAGGTVSVLRASCDSTEGRKSIKEGHSS